MDLNIVETQSPEVTVYWEIVGWIVGFKSEHAVSIEPPSFRAKFDDREVVPIPIHYVEIRGNLCWSSVWLGNGRVANPGAGYQVGMVDV